MNFNQNSPEKEFTPSSSASVSGRDYWIQKVHELVLFSWSYLSHIFPWWNTSLSSHILLEKQRAGRWINISIPQMGIRALVQPWAQGQARRWQQKPNPDSPGSSWGPQSRSHLPPGVNLTPQLSLRAVGTAGTNSTATQRITILAPGCPWDQHYMGQYNCCRLVLPAGFRRAGFQLSHPVGWKGTAHGGNPKCCCMLGVQSLTAAVTKLQYTCLLMPFLVTF